MKQIRALAVASLFVVPSLPAASFSDIQQWAGAGTNQAALVIDWNDGKAAESLLWGYRWNGTATGLDMLLSVVAADPGLYAHIGTYSWGTAVYGLGYNLNGDATFGVTPALTFNGAGISTTTNPDDTRTAIDPANHWVEGWNTGFWDYYTKATVSDAWSESLVGSADRQLTGDAWDGYSFAPGFASSAPVDPVAAVPEPTALALLASAGMLLVCAKRQKS